MNYISDIAHLSPKDQLIIQERIRIIKFFDEYGEKATKEASYEIELISSELDTLPGDSDMLDTLFATASSNKTASSDKKKGVSRLGGTTKVASNDSALNNLSSLWKSDPDVSGDFR